MKARSPDLPKWVLLDYQGPDQPVTYVRFGRFMPEMVDLHEADLFESEALANKTQALSGISHLWAVRRDRVEEWLVMKALQWHARANG